MNIEFTEAIQLELDKESRRLNISKPDLVRIIVARFFEVLPDLSKLGLPK